MVNKNKFNSIFMFILFSIIICENDLVLSKIIKEDYALNTYVSSFIKANDGGFIMCGVWEKYDLDYLNEEEAYESKINKIIDKKNGLIKESFVDCNETGSICEGDETWESDMGNGTWNEGEIFEDSNNNGVYDNQDLTDAEWDFYMDWRENNKNNPKEKIRKLFIKKLNENGDIIWEKEYDNFGKNLVTPNIVSNGSIYMIQNTGYIEGKMKSYGLDQTKISTYASNLVFIIDSEGNILSDTIKLPNGTCPVFSNDGSIVYADASSNSQDGYFNIYFMNWDGEILYQKSLGDWYNSKCKGYYCDDVSEMILWKIEKVLDGYVVIGYIRNTLSMDDIWSGGGLSYSNSSNDYVLFLLKTNLNGDTQEFKRLQPGKDEIMEPSLIQVDDGGFFFSSYEIKDGYYKDELKYSSYFLKLHHDLGVNETYGGFSAIDGFKITNIAMGVDNNYIATGIAYINNDGNLNESYDHEFQKAALISIGVDGILNWWTWLPTPEVEINNKYYLANDVGKFVLPIDDEGYIVVGETTTSENISFKKDYTDRYGTIRTKDINKEVSQTKVFLYKTDKNGRYK